MCVLAPKKFMVRTHDARHTHTVVQGTLRKCAPLLTPIHSFSDGQEYDRFGRTPVSHRTGDKSHEDEDRTSASFYKIRLCSYNAAPPPYATILPAAIGLARRRYATPPVALAQPETRPHGHGDKIKIAGRDGTPGAPFRPIGPKQGGPYKPC